MVATGPWGSGGRDSYSYYLVAGDGSCFYPLPGDVARRVVLGDGWTAKAARMEGRSYESVTWVRTPAPVSAIQLTRAPAKAPCGWRLRTPDAASERYPAEVSEQEWADRGWDGDGDDAYMAGKLYMRVFDEVPVEPESVDVSAMQPLTGEPDDAPRRVWVVDQPGCLIYTPNYWHLLPGHTAGLRAAVEVELRAKFGKQAVAARSDGTIEVTLHLEYDAPRWRERPRYGARGNRLKTTDKVKETLALKVPCRVFDGVAGVTKRAAIESFDQAVADWVDWVASHQVVLCGHCGGAGVAQVSGVAP